MNPSSFEMVPGGAVVFFAVGAEEGGVVFDGAFGRASGEGVVHVGFGHGALLEVLDVFPAEGDVVFGTFGAGDAVADAFLRIGFAGLAREADAGEALAGGEDDAPGLIEEGFGFVLAHHGELHAVDGEQFFQREAEGLGDEDVDLQQGLPAGVVGTEGAVAVPVGHELVEEILRQPGSGISADRTRPRSGPEGIPPVFAPKTLVKNGQTVEGKRPDSQRHIQILPKRGHGKE